MEVIPMRHANFDEKLYAERKRQESARPIPISTSQPDDPSAPSFLTTLPGEIRNEIYKLLFTQEEPLVLLDTHRYRKETEWDGWPESENEIEHGEYEDSDIDVAPEASESPDHEHGYPHEVIPASILIGPAIALLRSCKQVHHETIGVLYSANSFLITVPLHRHNMNMAQIQFAASWMRKLGSNSGHLRRVIIDVDPFCPVFCLEEEDMDTETSIDLFPLIQVFWEKPDAARVVSFKKRFRENGLSHALIRKF